MSVFVTRMVRLLIVAAALALASGTAGARPNPCLSLSSIVAGYSNTSSHHGKTAAQVFASLGKLTLFAKLGQAAAHVQDHEPDGTGINVISPNADAAYGELSDRIRWLDAADLNPYSGVTLSPELAADPVFCTRGLLGGIYARGNSAVLVGRVADALFVAFRATNDGWSLTETPVTPDALDWTHQGRHYNRYQYLLPALMAYVADHPEIAHVYVAGDSLGAAMAQKFMLAHGGDGRFEARLFGSPGNPQIARQDHRIWTFIDDNDPIILVPALKYKLSGKRFLIHIGRVPDVPPRGIFHNPQAYVRMMELLDDHGRGETYLRGKFAGGSLSRWNALFLRLRIVSEDPEEFAAGVPGTLVGLPGSEPRAMFGGDGPDTIIGGFGDGDLFGFGGEDCLRPMNRPERLFGGAGPDWFILRGMYRAYGASIMDFKSGTDKVVALNTLPAFTSVVDGRNFIRGTTPSGPRPTLLYDRSTGRLKFDFDGTGAFPPYLVGKFPSKPDLRAADIALREPAHCL